jgi:transposase
MNQEKAEGLSPELQAALEPFGPDCDLRRWGLKLAERGGRNGKKRAIVATARKLAVLLHHLWVSGEVYEPLHNSCRVAVYSSRTKQNCS